MNYLFGGRSIGRWVEGRGRRINTVRWKRNINYIMCINALKLEQ